MAEALKWIYYNLLTGSTQRETYIRHKLAHALGGLLIYLVFASIGYHKTGLVFVYLAGCAKELYDKRHGGEYRIADTLFTVSLALLVFIVTRF